MSRAQPLVSGQRRQRQFQTAYAVFQFALVKFQFMPADSAPALPQGEAAYRRLLDDITTLSLPPGRRLTERRLATETGYGVSPIREALTRLDHDGLVITLPRKGYQVKPLTIRSVDDLLNFWEIIGPEVARRGIESATLEQHQELLDLLTDWEKQVGQAKWEHSSSTTTIHMATKMFNILAVAMGNFYLTAVHDKLMAELNRVFMLIMDAESTDHTSLFLKTEIKPAIEHRDGELLAKEVLRFISDSHDKVLQLLARWPSVMATEVEPLRPKA